jgi:hypothetical protein
MATLSTGGFGLKVTFVGDETPEVLAKKLLRLGDKLSGRITRKGLKDAGRLVLAQAQVESFTNKSGEATGATSLGLKLKAKKLKRDLKGVNAIFVSTPTREELASLNPNYSKDDAYYPAIQTYTGNNFLEEAFNKTEGRFVQIFRKSVFKSIQREAKRRK